MSDKNGTYDTGWRSMTPSTARVQHYLDEDGKALCSPSFIPIQLTNSQIEKMPKIFPAKRVAALRRLPVCHNCLGRAEGTRVRSYWAADRDRLIKENEQLKAEMELLKQELATKTIQLAQASALIGR